MLECPTVRNAAIYRLQAGVIDGQLNGLSPHNPNQQRTRMPDSRDQSASLRKDLAYDFGKGGNLMGGSGSGRRRDSKDTTSSFLQLDVRRLQRSGLLAPGRRSEEHTSE